MSLLSLLNKRQTKLEASIKQTAQARISEASTADNLFKGAYQGYAEVLLDDPIRADALYNWGFALLHQAKTKTGLDAAKIYQDAISKFAFCRLINPTYLGAAINGGVAYMDLARNQQDDAHSETYDLAKKQFETANAIHKGTASYNLACIFALRGEHEACLQALEHSRDNGSLPDATEIIVDPDMSNVYNQTWFVDFIDGLNKPEVVVEPEIVIVEAETNKAE
ncbi:MAG: hypothetical protein K9L60_00420 [Methylovulum sp.]|jgi:hypothetical protein|nr:hypothetical protein [Methylovulum sp.]MCF7997433.1 hypothetical protein [Methylovulum sp.]